jgi:uncharacterized protein (DUF2461 family)
METRFHGWPDDAHQVLLELDGEPSRSTRERLRRRREVHVRRPMIDLLNDLADLDPWYEDFSVWGYGTTAYWWQNQSGVARVARYVYMAFRFNLDGLRVAACWRYAGSEQIALFRAAVGAEDSGCELQALVSSLAADGHEIGGDVMKRGPRGFPADHPRADLLRYRSLSAATELESETVLDVEPVYRACERLRPLLSWFAEHTTATAPAEADTVVSPR